MTSPETVTEIVQQLKDQAARLGLTWQLTYATVVDGSSTAATTVTIDGDTGVIPVVSLIGGRTAGSRVAVMTVPPAGNYIIGADIPIGLPEPYGLHGNGIADSTAVGGYVNLAAPSSFTLTKRYASTRVRMQMTIGFFVSAVTAGIDAGVTFDGGVTDYQVTRYGATTVAGVHLQTSGLQYVSGLAAGPYTVQGRWARTGIGTLSRNGDDWLSIEAMEVSP